MLTGYNSFHGFVVFTVEGQFILRVEFESEASFIVYSFYLGLVSEFSMRQKFKYDLHVNIFLLKWTLLVFKCNWQNNYELIIANVAHLSSNFSFLVYLEHTYHQWPQQLLLAQ